jgi:hypothetical protein
VTTIFQGRSNGLDHFCTGEADKLGGCFSKRCATIDTHGRVALFRHRDIVADGSIYTYGPERTSKVVLERLDAVLWVATGVLP